MSVTAMGMALEVTGISPRAKVVLIAICNCAGEYTFEGYPSRRDLARVADCSIDTVDRCLRELADEGWLEKSERARDDGRGQTSNLYRVFPAHDPSRKNAEGGKATPSREITEGGQRISAAPQPHKLAAPPAARDAAPKEPVSEPLDVISSPSVPLSKANIEWLIEYAGSGCNATAPDVHHGADLNRFLRAGCDWTEDVLPAVDKLSASFQRRGKLFGSWSLLEEHVIQNRDRRLAGLPAPQPVNGNTPNSTRPRREGWAEVIDRVVAEQEAKRVS